MYHSMEEISRQSGSLKRTWSSILDRSNEVTSFFMDCGDVVFIACGSSYWLSLSAHITFAMAAGVHAHAVKAGDIVLNPDEFTQRYVKPVLVMPSRSGATSEQLEALRILREAYGEIKVLSAVEYKDSPLEASSDLSFHIPWANETSVCQTRSFSNLYTAMVALAAVYDSDLRAGMERYLDARPALEARDFPRGEEVILSFPQMETVTALGSGRQYGVTVEGAYICIEMAQMLCSYFGLLEYRHGPIVTANAQTLLAICSNGTALGHEEKMAAEAAHYGVQVLAVAANQGFEQARWRFTLGGDYPVEAVALHFVFILQSIAYHAAIARGHDPDQPGDLVPFIQI